MKLLRITLCALLVSASSAWAGNQSWTISAFYNGTAPDHKYQTSYFVTLGTTQISTAVYGGIPAGGAAVAIDSSSGPICATSINIPDGIAPGGTPFGMGNSGVAPAGINLVVWQMARSNGPGGYATSYVSASW